MYDVTSLRHGQTCIHPSELAVGDNGSGDDKSDGDSDADDGADDHAGVAAAAVVPETCKSRSSLACKCADSSQGRN